MATEPFENGYALIIGVGGDLPDTVNDARELHRILTDPEKGAYPPDQVTLLTAGGADRDKVATAFDDLAQRLAADARPNATALVYYSGHGGYDEQDAARPFYLLTNGYQLQDLPGTALRGDVFSAKLDALGGQSKKLIVLLDACHAGEVKAAGRGRITPNTEQIVSELDRGSGRVVIASSLSSQLSLMDRQAGVSVFTRYLIEGLEGKNTPKSHPYVSFADLWEHLGTRVPERSKELGREQTPVINVRDGTFFYLSRNGAGTPPRPRLFIDFADEDLTKFVEPFEEQLGFLIDGGLIDGVWHRKKIGFGDRFKQIDENLKDCQIFVELRGPNYRTYQIQEKTDRKNTAYPKTALETAIERRIPRIPVILRKHFYTLDPTIRDYNLKVYPEENGQVKPVANWDDQNDAFFEVVGRIQEIVESINV